MNEDLIKYRLSRAKETLKDAEILISNNRLNSAVNRIYYSLYYAVLALLETKGLASSKHSGVRALFNFSLGLIPRSLLRHSRESGNPDSRFRIKCGMTRGRNDIC